MFYSHKLKSQIDIFPLVFWPCVLLSDDDGMMQWMASDFCDKHKHNTHTKGTKRLLEWQLWSDAMMIASNIYRQTQKQHIKRRLKEKKLNHLHMMHWVFVERQTQHTQGDSKRKNQTIFMWCIGFL